MQLCHSGAGVKDTQNVNVVGTKIHCKNCVFVQCVCLNCDTVAHVLGNVLFYCVFLKVGLQKCDTVVHIVWKMLFYEGVEGRSSEV